MMATDQSDRGFDAAPLMTSVPAVAVRPEGFLIAPRAGQASIAFGASPAPDGGAMLCVSIAHEDGTMLIAAVPEKFLPELTKAISDAARQMEARRYAQPGAMQ